MNILKFFENPMPQKYKQNENEKKKQYARIYHECAEGSLVPPMVFWALNQGDHRSQTKKQQ